MGSGVLGGDLFEGFLLLRGGDCGTGGLCE